MQQSKTDKIRTTRGHYAAVIAATQKAAKQEKRQRNAARKAKRYIVLGE